MYLSIYLSTWHTPTVSQDLCEGCPGPFQTSSPFHISIYLSIYLSIYIYLHVSFYLSIYLAHSSCVSWSILVSEALVPFNRSMNSRASYKRTFMWLVWTMHFVYCPSTPTTAMINLTYVFVPTCTMCALKRVRKLRISCLRTEG